MKENRKVNSVKTFPKLIAALLLLLPLAVAQETRPDEQTHVFQENGRWSRQITGSLPAAKNLRVKVDSGSVRVQGGSQQTIKYSISNRSYASSEEKARHEFEVLQDQRIPPRGYSLGGRRMAG